MYDLKKMLIWTEIFQPNSTTITMALATPSMEARNPLINPLLGVSKTQYKWENLTYF